MSVICGEMLMNDETTRTVLRKNEVIAQWVCSDMWGSMASEPEPLPNERGLQGEMCTPLIVSERAQVRDIASV